MFSWIWQLLFGWMSSKDDSPEVNPVDTNNVENDPVYDPSIDEKDKK